MVSSLSERISAYGEFDNYFGFLRTLTELSDDKIEEHSNKLINFYEDDIDENLTTELIRFKEFFTDMVKKTKDTKISTELKMYKLIIEKM